MKRTWVLLIAATALQGAEPKGKPGDYPLHASAANVDIGVEFQVRTVFGARGSFVTEDYLVVEVALYPKTKEGVLISTSHFTLKLNGKKILFPQAPGFVAASMKYPDWDWQRGTTVQAGVGNRDVILGGPGPSVGRFPGDRRDPNSRVPDRPRAGASASGVEIEKENPIEVVNSQALPEGNRTKPASGYIYFPHKGELGKLKSIDLVYEQPDAAPIVLRLR